MNFSARRLLLTLASVAPLAGLGFSTAAQAAVGDSLPCNSAPMSRPFALWGDTSPYELAPGGDFETVAWTLTGTARTVSGSEPFATTGSMGSSALSAPAGSSATSPLTCLNAADRTLRMFVGGTGVARVSIVYKGVAIPVGAIRVRGHWRPSPIISIGDSVFRRLAGGTGDVSVRITGLAGNPVLDDVFIDPWQRT